jgi:hypothetical protein
MPRSALATQQAVDEGITVAFTAANAAGHSIAGGGDVVLLVNNASGGSINVTVQTAATEDGLAVADQVVAVAAGAIKAIGPFRATTYDRAGGAADPGTVYVDFSAVASVTVAALGV